MRTLAFVLGTRPEIIKLAPVIRECTVRKIPHVVIHTGQHKALADEMFSLFAIKPDVNLGVMQQEQNLTQLSSRILSGLSKSVEPENISTIVVQGDTTSAFVGALFGHHHKIAIAHVEAGLRSGNCMAPFPEEFNRIWIGRMATFHFCPLTRHKKQLEAEGINPSGIYVTGNTVIDALQLILAGKSNIKRGNPAAIKTKKYWLLTVHRRENLSKIEEILDAALLLIKKHEDTTLLFPAHPNPEIQKIANAEKYKHPRFLVQPPLPYPEMLSVMKDAELIFTDSGGIQEEATALGKYCVVLREQTERWEIIETGIGILAGAHGGRIKKAAEKFLGKLGTGVVPSISSIYGDGTAAGKIMDVLEM